MKNSHPSVHQIELRIVELQELINSMDPTPLPHRDLDADAEKWAFHLLLKGRHSAAVARRP